MSNQNNLVKLSSSYDQDFWDNNPYIVNGRLVGEIIPVPRKFIPLSRQWPAISLTRISSYADLLSADAPDFHNVMRQEFIEVEDDSTTFHDEFGVSTISGQDITLLDTPENNYLLADLYEDALVHGGGQETPSYTNWLPLTGDNGVDYTITAINVGTRTITVSGSIGAFDFVKFSQYRVGGDTSRVRVYSQRGQAIVGAGKTGTNRSSNGLRRRGYMQGHHHEIYRTASGSGGSELEFFSGNSAYGPTTLVVAREAKTDGTNGTPRTGPETHGPDFGVEVYQWLGRYLGA